MLFTCLPVLFLLGTVAKGILAADQNVTAPEGTSNETSTTTSSDITVALSSNSSSNHTATDYTSLSLFTTPLRGDTASAMSTTRRIVQSEDTSETLATDTTDMTSSSMVPELTTATNHSTVTINNPDDPLSTTSPVQKPSPGPETGHTTGASENSSTAITPEQNSNHSTTENDNNTSTATDLTTNEITATTALTNSSSDTTSTAPITGLDTTLITTTLKSNDTTTITVTPNTNHTTLTTVFTHPDNNTAPITPATNTTEGTTSMAPTTSAANHTTLMTTLVTHHENDTTSITPVTNTTEGTSTANHTTLMSTLVTHHENDTTSITPVTNTTEGTSTANHTTLMTTLVTHPKNETTSITPVTNTTYGSTSVGPTTNDANHNTTNPFNFTTFTTANVNNATTIASITNTTNGTTSMTPAPSTTVPTPTDNRTETTNPTSGPTPSSPSTMSSSLSPNTSPFNSTVNPTGNTITPSASATTTAETNTTTVSNASTSPEPDSNKTTVIPAPQTTSNTTQSTVTTISVTSQWSTGVTNSTTVAPPIPTSGSIIVCPEKPCPRESICLSGTCQCVSGSFMENGQCVKAQVFPGQLHLISLNYTSEMSDRSSKIFQEKAAQISATLRTILKDQPGYLRSDVVQLRQGSVVATVNNIYEDTNVTQEEVNKAIDQAINSSRPGELLAGASFSDEDLCQQKPLPCDVHTTSCAVSHGSASCSCQEGYVSFGLYTNSSCRACPSGQRAVGNTCEPCSFGYAGFNCNDSALLAVVVVSCVLGGILLILILALLIYCCCKCCSNTKRDSPLAEDFSSPYGYDNEPWPADIPHIPRASTTNRNLGTSIEMTEGLGDRKNHTNGLSGSYELEPEELKTFKGKPTSPSRYSYLVQGHENPYFLAGDGKKN